MSKLPCCGICGHTIAELTNSSRRGAPVHNSCFGRVGGRHRSESSLGRSLRRRVADGIGSVKAAIREVYNFEKRLGRWTSCD